MVVLLVPPLLFGGAWSDWLYRALVLLVIACPCALVISTPVSIVAALASAARHGVLVKGGLFIEVPARIRAVALDKTGTLTWGRPAVVEVVPFAGHDERELLERVGALEARSEHPLARAILAYAKDRSAGRSSALTSSTPISRAIASAVPRLSPVPPDPAFSLLVKAVFVVLTFAGHASLWAAIAADMGASLLVVFNGLRLLGGSEIPSRQQPQTETSPL
jgi:cation transport ATPase